MELYLQGGLPVGGPAGVTAQLDSLWLGRAERLPADERHELFERAVGPSFSHLLGRLAAALAEAGEDEDAVAWAADELRSHVEAHIDDDERAAAALLTSQLADALAILSDAEILNAYGASDPWQLTDQLARLELGSTLDIEHHQTLAAAGALIIAWLAGDDPAVTEEIADAARSWLAAADLA